MARKKPATRRVEPRFGDESSTALRADRKDRPSRSKSRKSSLLFRLLRGCLRPVPFLAYWSLVLGLWGGIALVGVFGWYAAKMPNASDWAIPERPPNIRIIAEDASLIGNRGVTGGKALRLEEMSPYIPQAVIAIEDRRFHAHFGFDPIGFARAMTRNLFSKQLREGGSTITQQLAKNLFLTPERTFGRKVQELILSVWLETKFSKAEILELYLNRVYFGAGATGIDAASRRYFGKSADKVNVGEAALLAGLLKAPSRYSPATNQELAQERTRVVLAAMQREGYLKPGKLDLQDMKPGENAKNFRSGPEHFITDMVVRDVRELVGELDRDVVVETTISPFLMTAAQSIVEETLDQEGKRLGVSQASLVSLAPDGAIRALIGGRDYADSQFNRAVEARRQPGSAFKTFVWLNALDRGLTPDSIIQDIPVRYGKWKPENYDLKYRGPVTLNQAFAQSLNTVSAQLTMQAGPQFVAGTASRLGIASPMAANASLALGTSEVSLLELASAYAPFANGGVRAKPYLINRITTASGKVLYQRPEPLPIEVVSPSSLGQMNTMLRSVLRNGTGKAAQLDQSFASHDAGGKTGTSQNFRDAWFIGHTAQLVTGVWFGNDDNSPTKKLTGGSLPAKVWKNFMQVALHDLPGNPLPGESTSVALLPDAIPVPKSRPQLDNRQGVDQQKVASLRERVEGVQREKSGKTILDIILGN